jgi:WhiB family redox-sensing transcriptional regulator
MASSDDYWKVKGLCARLKNPDPVFFPRQGMSTDRAKRLCKECPVRVLCAAYAIAHGESYGVWGGLSSYQRKRLPREKVRAIRAMWFRMHPDAPRH